MAAVVGAAETAVRKRRTPAISLSLANEEDDVGAACGLLDVAASGGRVGRRAVLRLPVEQRRRDRVVGVAGRRGEVRVRLLQGDEQEIRLRGFVPEDSALGQDECAALVDVPVGRRDLAEAVSGVARERNLRGLEKWLRDGADPVIQDVQQVIDFLPKLFRFSNPSEDLVGLRRRLARPPRIANNIRPSRCSRPRRLDIGSEPSDPRMERHAASLS